MGEKKIEKNHNNDETSLQVNKFDNEISKIANEFTKTQRIGKTLVCCLQKASYLSSLKSFLNFESPGATSLINWFLI